MMKRLVPTFVAVALALIGAVAFSAPAGAADCGGVVLCSCGDNVVDDAVLTTADPVVGAACSGNGLVMNTADVELDLGGFTIQGSGTGFGIRVEAVDGVTIMNGKIRGFQRGIDGTNPAPKMNFSTIESLRVSNNKEDGIKVQGRGNELTLIRVDKNGRHGINVEGGTADDPNILTEIKADKNSQIGIKVGGKANLSENSAKKNGGKGIDAPDGTDDGGNTCKKNGQVGTIGGTPC